MSNPKEQLDDILVNLEEEITDFLRAYILEGVGGRAESRAPFIKAKAAITDLINKAKIEARKEQIMQDFNYLSLELDKTDESRIISWREEQLSTLLGEEEK